MQDYFDNMFRGVDESIKLDDDQIKIVTTDDRYMMVIAGAGSGKTTTISAKVNYLIDIEKVKDEEILVISFTNKAVSELYDRINNDFKHNVSIMTFHKFGYEIIKENSGKKPTVVRDKKVIIKNYIEKELICNQRKLKEFLDFYIYYFDFDEDLLFFSNYDKYCIYKGRQKYPTLKCKIEYIKENLNYLHETIIANFLYVNNIKYDYKKVYPFDEGYVPDFTFYSGDKVYYIEYFNMDKMNKFKFERNINRIERIHKKYHTDLIKIFAGDILDSLNIELKKRNIITKEIGVNELFDKLILKNKDNQYKRFIDFCSDFITLYKANGYGINDFNKLNRKSKRNSIFFKFIEGLYNYYEAFLESSFQIDFDDMIIKANKLVLQCQSVNLRYKYIIIDEYQDISNCRFELIRNISSKINCHIMVVGDDWQCIYSFASSNINLFTNFCNLVGSCTVLKIVKTYRNSQQLIDIAGDFVLKNNCQIKKKLISPKQLDYPVKILSYKKLDDGLERAIIYLEKKYINKNILILGRYSFDKDKVVGEKFKVCNNQIVYKGKKYDFMTVHASKGLGYDNVIIINALDDILGFPSKIKNDPIIDELVINDENIKYSEERRLFYVALTRTKNEVIILSPDYNSSVFVSEIKKYKGVKKFGKLRMIK